MYKNRQGILIGLLILALCLGVLNLLELVRIYHKEGSIALNNMAALTSLLISAGLFVYNLYRKSKG